MNALPIFVSAFLLKGGLNHIIFLRLLSWFGGLCGDGLNLSRAERDRAVKRAGPSKKV